MNHEGQSTAIRFMSRMIGKEGTAAFIKDKISGLKEQKESIDNQIKSLKKELRKLR